MCAARREKVQEKDTTQLLNSREGVKCAHFQRIVWYCFKTKIYSSLLSRWRQSISEQAGKLGPFSSSRHEVSIQRQKLLCKQQRHWRSASLYCPSTLSLGTNLSESLNIQKRDEPSSGPSFTNSWPSPFPHLPHRTLKAVRLSMCFVTLSSRSVSVKAGHGEECSYLDRLENKGCLHWEQT